MIEQEKNIKCVSKNLQNRCCMNKLTSFMSSNKDGKPEKMFSLNLFDPNLKDLQLNNVEFASFAFYVIHYYDINLFSSRTKEWTRVAPENDFDDLKDHAACLFMGDLYVTGGEYNRCLWYSDFLFKFDTKTNEWNKLAEMHQYRSGHSCVVFGGKIVVTGGNSGGVENSVEAYDHYNDEWSYMPNLTEAKQYHGSAAMGNKLYVIAGYKTRNCEVFDFVSDKFVRIKPVPLEFDSSLMFETLRVQNRIVVKCDGDEVDDKFYFYNTADDEWTSARINLFKERPAELLYF